MRKLFYTLFAMLMGIATATAQDTWPMPGAQWIYKFYVATQGPEGVTETQATEIWNVTGDSLVEGRIYTVIKPTVYYCTLGNLNIDENKILLTRSSNDTVYRYVNNQEYIYFVFNMEYGDTYTTYRSAGWNNFGNDSTCSSAKPLRAIETSTITVGNMTLKKTVLEDTIFGELYQKDWNKNWTLVERIGIIGRDYPLIDINEIFSNTCNYMFICAEFNGLVSYKDNEIDYSPYSLKESKNYTLSVHPNPTMGTVSIILPDKNTTIRQIEVRNMLGTSVLEKANMQGNTLDVSALPAGVYIVRVVTNEGKEVFAKLVKK